MSARVKDRDRAQWFPSACARCMPTNSWGAGISPGINQRIVAGGERVMDTYLHTAFCQGSELVEIAEAIKIG